ncbi:hypothetical protein [Ferrimicrobium sp.]|uniref:hypothetical protein n=1 Tax=Ferrimicrobium sp. TaxID=2926050 RepID=UPI002601F79A|nr:hypothetical protein [Ferrimicrobium sp.]
MWSRWDRYPEDASALAVRLAASGVSWAARLRPSVPDEVDEALSDMGLFAEDEILLMATSLVTDEVQGQELPGLTLSMRRAHDDLAITEVLGAVFGTPPANATKLLDPAHLECDEIQWHLGKVDGVLVSCAMSVVAADAVAIFAVGTVAEARENGYGSAVTLRALTHGFTGSARCGVLTASPEV